MSDMARRGPSKNSQKETLTTRTMIAEINQIKRWLAKRFELRLEGEGLDIKVVGTVPDGEYQIPIGRKPTKMRVVIRYGAIMIDP